MPRFIILFGFVLQPELSEIKKIASEGILTCLQDAIESLKQGQVDFLALIVIDTGDSFLFIIVKCISKENFSRLPSEHGSVYGLQVKYSYPSILFHYSVVQFVGLLFI